jgi:hypothetical protein
MTPLLGAKLESRMSLQLYRPKDVAVLICRSPKTVYRYIKKYNIPVIEHRGRGGRKEIFIRKNDLEVFLLNEFNDFKWAFWMMASWLKSAQPEGENNE